MGASVTTAHPIEALKLADEEVQRLCHSVKGQAEEREGKKYDTFEAKSYKTQILDHGTSYFVTVHVGENKYADIFFLKQLSGQLVLQSIKEY